MDNLLAQEIELLSQLAEKYQDRGKANPRKLWPDILKVSICSNYPELLCRRNILAGINIQK